MIGGEYSALAFRKSTNGLKLEYFESETKKEKAQVKDTNTNDRKLEQVLYSVEVNSSITTAVLRIVFGTDKVCHMYYKLDGDMEFTKIPFTSTPKDHTWVGAKTGIFSTGLEPCSNHGFADFTEVSVTMS